jgi:hypothetical protein
MAKRIALKDYIEVYNVDLSNFCRSINFTSTDERIDASGFNNNGYSEFLSGARVREVTCEFMNARGSNEVHQVLFQLHDSRAEFDFAWRADGSASVGATNEELRGTVILPDYNEGATRGELEVMTITFIEADAASPLTFYST